MRKMNNNDINIAKANARSEMIAGSEKDFITRDVVNFCVNPVTSEALVDENASTYERYSAFRSNKIDYDADVSLHATAIYEEVFSFVNRFDKSNFGKFEVSQQKTHNKYGLKYELANPASNNGVVFRGDTMNSVTTTNMEYYRKHKEDTEYRDKGFKLPKEALDLVDLYHTMGNFLILPFKYGGGSINCSRGTGSSRDYFDLFLMAIYNAYLEMEGGKALNKITLLWVLKKDETLAAFMESYLRSFIEDGKSGWDNFVRKNLLQDFVTLDRGINCSVPKELWKGHFKAACSGRVRPKTDKEFYEFWTNAAARIKNRSFRIYKELQLGDLDSDYFEPVIYNL